MMQVVKSEPKLEKKFKTDIVDYPLEDTASAYFETIGIFTMISY
jgi:hypothetical protein